MAIGASLFAQPLLPAPGQPAARRLALFVMALAPFLVAALALALGQDANWDFRNYHWYNGYAVAMGRLGFDLLPSQTPAFYNPALDVPFYLLASHVSAKTAAFILGLVQGLNFPLLFMLAHGALSIPHPRQKVWACAALAGLGILGGGGIALIGTTFYDNVTSLGLWVSALTALRFGSTLFEGSWTKALGIAFATGLPAGLAMGLKLPCVAFCVGLCGAFFFVKGPLVRRFFLSFSCGLGILAGLAVSLGPWAAYLYSTYQNPLFPYFNDVFGSPYAPATDARDVKFLPHGFFDRLFFPFIFTADPLRVGEIPWRDLRLPLLYLLWPMALAARMLFGRNKRDPDLAFRPYAARFLLGFAAGSYFVWLFLFAIYRYLIPLEMLAPLLLVFAIGMLPVRPRMRFKTTLAVLILVVATVVPGDWGRKNPWLDTVVQADVPTIENPSSTMILMAGYEPYSHVLTSFPPEIPFVRIQSNFTAFDTGTAFWALIAHKVNAHQGLFKILLPDWELATVAKTLAPLALTPIEESCRPVRDRLYDLNLILCDLHRTGAPP